MACYSGQVVTWDEAVQSEIDLAQQPSPPLRAKQRLGLLVDHVEVRPACQFLDELSRVETEHEGIALGLAGGLENIPCLGGQCVGGQGGRGRLLVNDCGGHKNRCSISLEIDTNSVEIEDRASSLVGMGIPARRSLDVAQSLQHFARDRYELGGN